MGFHGVGLFLFLYGAKVSVNRQEAIASILETLALMSPKFKTGIINPLSLLDTGQETHVKYCNEMKRVLLGPTQGRIFKLRGAGEFYEKFVKKTEHETDPNIFALEFVRTIQAAQNSALDAAKSVLPEIYWDGLDSLKEI